MTTESRARELASTEHFRVSVDPDLHPEEGIITLVLWETTFGLTPGEWDELVGALTQAQAEAHKLDLAAMPVGRKRLRER